MATVLHRTTKELRPSVHTPDFPRAEWIINPDLSAVQGHPRQYWKISGDTVSLMTALERERADDDIVAKEILNTTFQAGNFGDGSDGVMTIASNRTLTQDIYPTKLIVEAGVTLSAAGFRIVAKDGIHVLGTIENRGKDAKGASGGAGGASATLGGGGSGAAGQSALAAGAAASALNADTAKPGIGGAGAAGGSDGLVSVGGAGGATADVRAMSARPNRFGVALEMSSLDSRVTGGRVVFHGGAGGGAGGADGVLSTGGGGGGGGGIVVIAAPIILIGAGGVVSVAGGKGGDAAGANAGGGGGGGGGVTVLLYNRLRNSGALEINGGAGGVKAGSGTAGGRGSAGQLVSLVVATAE